MIQMDIFDVLRDLLGAMRIQYLRLGRDCTSPEASGLDFQFRGQLYENFDYAAFASSVMAQVPPKAVIDFKDDFGAHYLVFRDPSPDSGTYFFLGPFIYHSYTDEELQKTVARLALSEWAEEALQWYYKRIPLVHDVISFRHLFSSLLSRYLANPDVEIHTVSHQVKPLTEKPPISLSSIPYTSIEARYETEAKMLDAIRRGNISEAVYYQNLFMGFRLDPRVDDPLRNAKDMVIAASAAMRKAVEQAQVHPLYIDDLSGMMLREIEACETEAQVSALVPRMIRHYCLLVQTYSRAQYSSIVRDLLNFVDFHYFEPLSLESLSIKYSVNKNYLSTRFHKEVGMTVTDYINLTRVRRSCEFLRTTTLNMPEIAERCGFSDANYFTRRFRKIQGVSPSQYRKSLQH